MANMYKALLLVLVLTAVAWCQTQEPPPPLYTLQELLEGLAKQGAAGGPTAAGGISNLLLALLQMLLRNFMRPLMSNVGVGMANALTASLMGRELTLIPDAVSPMPQRG